MERTKIMVVDDEKQICENVAKILKKNNYEIETATSADEAMKKMAGESFSLLISDIVMPEKNGLELLNMVKNQWPTTKAVMMTAYASTDTAMKAIRLGALDYVPKPFTPNELRKTVEAALEGKLIEAKISEEERKTVDPIDLDIPFDRDEVAKAAGEAYADSLGPSDMPVVEVKAPEALENFCEVGDMVCEIFEKLGATCKVGVKKSICPKLAKEKKGKAAKKAQGFDGKTLIGIDQPFNYEEVKAVTGPEYVNYLQHDGVVMPTYEELKANMEVRIEQAKIDVDVPFDSYEVAKATGEQYAKQAGRSDIPAVEVTASEDLEGFCEMGNMVCDIFKKLGATCKAGIKKSACPQLAKKKKAAAKKSVGFDAKKLIGVDMPFDYKEVAQITGPEYVEHLVYDGVVQTPYEQLKANVAQMMAEAPEEKADVIKFPDAPVSRNILVVDDEVAVNNNIRKILAKKRLLRGPGLYQGGGVGPDCKQIVQACFAGSEDSRRAGS
jgi:CheY-like chemotaxis protein